MNSTIAGCTLHFYEHQHFVTWMACRALDLELNGKRTNKLVGLSNIEELLVSRLSIHPRTARKWLRWCVDGKWLEYHEQDDSVTICGETAVTKKFISQVKAARAEAEINEWLPGMPMLGNPVRMDVAFSEVCDPHLPGKTRSELHDLVSVFTSLMAWSRTTLAKFVDKHIVTSRRYHNRTHTFREAQFLGINAGADSENVIKADLNMRKEGALQGLRALQSNQTKASHYIGYEVPSKFHSKYSQAKQSAHFARRLKLVKPEVAGAVPNATMTRMNRLRQHVSALVAQGSKMLITLNEMLTVAEPALITPTFLGYGSEQARMNFLFGGSG